MSWSWNEEIEKKDYETKGTVTISTDEYRDMIRQMYDLHRAGQKEHDDWYQMMKERDSYKDKYETDHKRLVEFDAWLEDDGESKTKFKLWKVEKEGK